MTFEIRDGGDGDGWTGVSADTLEGARLACITITGEGYDVPLRIVPADRDVAVETLTGFDESGRPIWQTSDAGRCYDLRRAA